MKSILILILSLSFSLTVTGQTLPDVVINSRNDYKNEIVNGVKEGKWLEYANSNDSIIASKGLYNRVTVYKAGKPFGVVGEYWNDCGKLSKELWYYSTGK